ncbi:MAG: D-alanyl-D-alanine carboxypeptidase/D-alanyl-D-alanine-endopeptidase [Opitutales bacterium]
MRRFTLLLLLLCVPGFGRAQDAPPSPPVRGAASLSELQAQLAAHLAQPRFAGAVWGVKVVSLDSGRPLFEQNPERRMSPASNCKLYTAALALVRLGGDYRIHTPLLATAAVDAAGVLPGDLIISGRGDPGWNSRPSHGDFWAVFEPFVAVLRQAGVRSIRGDVVADATWLRSPPFGASWTADDLNDYYGAELSAVSLLDNFVELGVAPGPSVGKPGRIDLLSPCTGLELENFTTTTAAGGEKFLLAQRLPGSARVQVYGRLPLGAAEERTEATVPRPAAWFAAGLAEALRRAGIEVRGRPRAVVWPEPSVHGTVRLGEIVSAPLRDLLASLMKSSQNLETDLIFAQLGEQRRQADTPEWVHSDELGVTALEEFLREFALRPEEVNFNEGSGLSRNNLATPAAFVRLLEFMAGRPEADAFRAALPLAGKEGTLRKRLKGTPAEGNLRAKTGSLRWASALSGYVTSAAGEHLAFSVLLNRYQAAPGHKAADELDEIAVLLASYGG